MGFLANKRILITGMISTRSIAYGVAQAMHREGAELAFTYQGERVRERVLDLAKQFDSKLVFQCDVASDSDINNLFISLNQHWDGFDGFVHAIAFAPREALEGEFLDGFSREAFRVAHDISAYSFPAMAKAALPMMEG
ncbi:MAG TPA: SDR family oxidoreductase, partial [Gallionella sp.]